MTEATEHVGHRQGGHQPRTAEVWLPGPDGALARVDDAVRPRPIGLVDDVGADHPDVEHLVASEAG